MSRCATLLVVAALCAYGIDPPVSDQFAQTEEIQFAQTESLTQEQLNVFEEALFKLLDKVTEQVTDGVPALGRLKARCQKYKLLGNAWNACLANWMVSELKLIDDVSLTPATGARSVCCDPGELFHCEK